MKREEEIKAYAPPGKALGQLAPLLWIEKA